MSIEHATFVITREYPAAPERVFRAWTDIDEKRRWFGADRLEGEIGVGGVEINHGEAPNGITYRYEARYHDLVEGERIVHAYDMYADERRMSVSLVTVELAPGADGGTALTYTETGAFLDEADGPAMREHGTGVLLDRLGELLREAAAARS